MVSRLFPLLFVAACGLVTPVISASLSNVRIAQAAPDEMAWGLVRDSADPAVLERYIEQFPDSPHAVQAREKLSALNDEGADIQADQENRGNDGAPRFALEIQRELKRLGCYGGALDGEWGGKSSKALVKFAQATGNRTGGEPTEDVLSKVRAASGQICEQPQSAPRSSENPTPKSGCVLVSAQIDARKANGNLWDVVGAPDPQITDTASGLSQSCKDSFQCSLRITGAGSPVSVKLMDMDLTNHDPIGSATCSVGRSCRAGAASISVQSC